MIKYNLSDTAILIPVRLDSIDRMDNLLAVVTALYNQCDVHVYILHADLPGRDYLKHMLPEQCRYIFIEDHDPVFHRTKYINQLAEISNEPILSIWDSDVVIPPKQIYEAVRNIRNRVCEVSFPYDGRFYEVDRIIKELYIEYSYDMSFLESLISKMKILYDKVQNGGALLISRDAFDNSNGEDETFYGWGPEDWNRVEKWKILNYRIKRVKGPLFHLTHSRDLNGNYRSTIHRNNCQTILNMTKISSSRQLSKGRFFHKSSGTPIINSKNGIWLDSGFQGHVYDCGFANTLIKFIKRNNIKSAADLGCGPGWYVADLNQFGVDCIGIDGNPNVILQSQNFPCAKDKCHVADLTHPIDIEVKDLILSIEVGEHIPINKEAVFIDNICCKASKYIIMSWAAPDQNGDGHINTHTIEYIIEVFRQRGFRFLEKESEEIRGGCDTWWLRNNIVCFENSNK